MTTSRDHAPQLAAAQDVPSLDRSDAVAGPAAGFLQRLLILLLVVAIATVSVLAFRTLCVVFAGVLLGVVLVRLSRALQNITRLPYRVSFAAVILALVGFVGLAGLFVIPRLSAQLNDLSSKLSTSVQELLTRMSEWGWVESVTDDVPRLGHDLLRELDAGALLGGVFSSLVGAFTAAFLILFIGFFLALDPELYRRGFLSLFPRRHRRRADKTLRASVDTLWWWTVGRLVAMTIVGAATALGLLLLGVPLALTLGALAGLVSFVPTIGAVLAIVPALLVAFQHGGPWMLVYVLGLYLAIQAVENNLITPLVQRQAVSIPPVVLIVSQVLMGLMIGIVGVAIATPLAALGLQLIRDLYIEEDSS